MIPQTFDQWKHCIEQDCNIQLTSEFAQKRLTVYSDEKNPETKKFVSLYGKQHLQNVVSWLQMVS